MSQYVAWPPPDELGALLDCAQRGDERALDSFLTVLRPSLLAYFAYRLPQDAAEDLTQLALIRITRALPRIDVARADRYVRTAARNLLRSAYRRQARDGRRYAADAFVDDAESRMALDLDVEYQELAQAIRQAATTSLPPPLARIVLGLLAGETTVEIAAKQDVSPITIRTRLLRARACLRRELRVYLEPPVSARRAGKKGDTSRRRQNAGASAGVCRSAPHGIDP